VIFGIHKLHAICPWRDVDRRTEANQQRLRVVQEAVDPLRTARGFDIEIGHAATK